MQVSGRLELSLESASEDAGRVTCVEVDARGLLSRNVQIGIEEARQIAWMSTSSGLARSDQVTIDIVGEIGRIVTKAQDQVAEDGHLILHRDVPIVDRETEIGEPSRRSEYGAQAPGCRMLGLEVARPASRGDLRPRRRGVAQRTSGPKDRRQRRKAIVIERRPRSRDGGERV